MRDGNVPSIVAEPSCTKRLLEVDRGNDSSPADVYKERSSIFIGHEDDVGICWVESQSSNGLASLEWQRRRSVASEMKDGQSIANGGEDRLAIWSEYDIAARVYGSQ